MTADAEHGDAASHVLVLFGGAGDLARTAILPALLELESRAMLPKDLVVVACGRRSWSATEYRRVMREALPEGYDVAAWRELEGRLTFARIDLAESSAYADLVRTIEEIGRERGREPNVLFHLATPPGLFAEVISNLEASGLSRGDGAWRRIIIEKPFGRDRASARDLERAVSRAFGEERVYRIDHFLGKEAVQSMLVFRFGNPAFEPIWNRHYVERVRILAAEAEGIGTRGAFYEETGALRDMVQNHLLQLLCTIAMEPPTRFAAGPFRDESAKVLDAVRALDIDQAVRGQYGPGRIAGTTVAGYREEESVDSRSSVETYAAVRLFVDNWRWAGVPFELATGKRLARKVTEIEVVFKPIPHLMFGSAAREGASSSVVFRIAPDASIRQTIAIKRPGPEMTIAMHPMEIVYAEVFAECRPLPAYAALLDDAMRGEQTLFARADWIDLAWRLIDPISRAWAVQPPTHFPNYAAGSWGPRGARPDGDRPLRSFG